MGRPVEALDLEGVRAMYGAGKPLFIASKELRSVYKYQSVIGEERLPICGSEATFISLRKGNEVSKVSARDTNMVEQGYNDWFAFADEASAKNYAYEGN